MQGNTIQYLANALLTESINLESKQMYELASKIYKFSVKNLQTQISSKTFYFSTQNL